MQILSGPQAAVQPCNDRSRSRREQLAVAPLETRVRDQEALPLSVALAGAARLRNHHGQIATLFSGVFHSCLEQAALQPSPAKLWYR